MDLELSGDTLTIENGDLVLVDGMAAIAQHLRIRLRFFRGEWFADQRIGIPFYDAVFLKRPNLGLIRSILRETITTTPGVLSVETLDFELDAGARRLSVEVAATTSSGTLDFSEEFILEVA